MSKINQPLNAKAFCVNICYLSVICLLVIVFGKSVQAHTQPNSEIEPAHSLIVAKLPEGAEPNTNRPGKDYKNFDLEAPKPKLCMAACEKDPKCRAYTYVKPGVQGEKARCWLKSAVPEPKKNKCCISGVKKTKEPSIEKSTEVHDAIPKGSYQQTCKGIKVSGTTLSAKCKTKSGWFRQKSTIEEFDRCTGDISNFDGYLTCNKSGELPPGSYLMSCTNPSLSGTGLTAICDNKKGHTITSTLEQVDHCTGDISNNDGYLTCEKSNAPAGSYLESCVNINISGTTLSAFCTTKKSRYGSYSYRKSTLEELDRCIGDISNLEAKLTCQKSGNVPSGSYMRTCTNPSLSGNTLSAVCEYVMSSSGDRRTKETTLEQTDLCVGDISNHDGYLTCEKSNAPPGSYLQSCVNINVSTTTLTARCRKETSYGHTWPKPTLREFDRCTGDISNFHGILTCQKSGNVPQGSYLQSCMHPSLSGTTLTAICETTSDTSKFSTLNDFDRCTGDISNNNGNLTCQKN